MNHIAFTGHAFDRVREQERLRLNINELELILLDPTKRIPIGTERRTSLTHFLFYSPPDKKCLIAVISIPENSLITILLLEYEHHFSIIPEAVNDLSNPVYKVPAAGEIDPHVSQFSFALSFYNYLRKGFHTKIILIKKKEHTRFRMTRLGLEYDPRMQRDMKNFIARTQLRYDRLDGIWVKLRKNTPLEPFKLKFD